MLDKFLFYCFINLTSFASAQHDTLSFGSTSVCWRHIPCFCDEGSIDEKTNHQAVNNLNYIRLRAGLKEVKLSDNLSKLSQEAAFICHKNKRQSHSIDQSWKCYSVLRGLACEVSLLASFGELEIKNDSLFVTKGFFIEPGNENKRLLHRRWLMNPNLDSIGYGSTKDYEAITPALSQTNRRKDFIKYSFPAPGEVDQEILSNRWSWSVYPSSLIDADSICVAAKCNDKIVPIKVICNDEFMGEFTLGFEIKDFYNGNELSKRYINQEITVTVSGYKLEGVSKVDEYIVKIIKH